MGSISSVCRRRHNTLSDIEGQAINVEEDFEQFTENDELLVVECEVPSEPLNISEPLVKKITSPYLSKKCSKKSKK